MTKKVTVTVEGREYIVEVGDLGNSPILATVNQRTYQVQVPAQTLKPSMSSPASAPKPTPEAAPLASGNVITSPMPGDILEVQVKPGDSVSPGDIICVLEAMKMRNMIRTPYAGVVGSVMVTAGQGVNFGTVLVTFE